MSNGRKAALLAAMLVIGLVAGNVATGWAAPSAVATGSPSSVAGWTGAGLRLGAAMRDAGGRLADVVAKLTGQDAEDVLAKRAAGESLAKIAADEGVKSSAVVDEALKVRKQVVDERVKAGALTQEQADAALARMETRLTERVESTDAGCNGAGGGRGGRGGGMGRGAGGCGGACTQAPAATQ